MPSTELTINVREVISRRLREMARALGVPAEMIEDRRGRITAGESIRAGTPIFIDGGRARRMTPARPRQAGLFCRLMPSGQEIDPTVKKIFHPTGRFAARNGERFDVCIMEAKSDPSIQMPDPFGFGNLKGERRDTWFERLCIGYPVRDYLDNGRRSFVTIAESARGNFTFEDVGRPIVPRIYRYHSATFPPQKFSINGKSFEHEGNYTIELGERIRLTLDVRSGGDAFPGIGEFTLRSSENEDVKFFAVNVIMFEMRCRIEAISVD